MIIQEYEPSCTDCHWGNRNESGVCVIRNELIINTEKAAVCHDFNPIVPQNKPQKIDFDKIDEIIYLEELENFDNPRWR